MSCTSATSERRFDAWTASIEKILNLNRQNQVSDDQNDTQSTGVTQTPLLGSDGEPIWKVLVFDNLGRDVISSILQVDDLRAWGVTIHLYAETIHSTPLASILLLEELTLINRS